MGTTSQKLTYLAGTKDKLKTTINYTGAGIDNTTTFRQYDEKLYNGLANSLLDNGDTLFDNLPKIQGSGTNITLNDTAESRISFLYKGNTQQDSTTGKNTFNNTLTNGSHNGLTYEVNADKSVKITGTATALTYINMGSWNLSGNYIFSGITGGSSSTYSLYLSGSLSNLETITTEEKPITNDGTSYNVVLKVASGKSVNEIVYPMIRPSNVSDDTYEPYTGGNPAPSPSYPQEIHNVSGDNTIEICGKNLFDLDNLTNAYLNSSGVPVSANNNVLSDYIPITSNQDYIISVNQQVEALGYALYDKDKTFISRVNTYSIQTKTLNSSTASYIRIYVNKNAQTFNTNSLVNLQPQLEKGSTATTYEPYTGQSQLISLGDIELNKIGNYQDYIYKTDKWYKHGKVGKYIFKGTEAGWWKHASGYFAIPLSNSKYGKVVCDNFMSNADTSTNLTCYCYGNGFFEIRYNDMSTLTDFKTWLTTHNTEVYYILATPTDTEITDSTLISQLEAIKRSYENQTNISQTNNDLPFILDVKAIQKYE